ncbi:MAG: hypothetical protein MJZ79_03600 [Paludibacteraceae bacterium]|nr:hypothetical protein [Paludibacteraceae bacterium]
MKEQLINIAEYIESLEQRIDALEKANIALQEVINGLQEQIDNLNIEPEMPEEPETPEEPIMPVEPEIPEESEVEPEVEPETPEIPEIPEQPEEPAKPEPKPQPEPVVGQAVADIRKAISLGDRFLFQRELFAGKGEQMQQVLDDINSLSSLDEAISYIGQFGWNTDSTTYELFINVLKRRFNH